MRPEGITRSQWFKYNLYLVAEHFIGLRNSEKYIRPFRQRLYKDILENNHLEGRGGTVDVSTIERDSFEPYLNNKKALMEGPLVFRGAAKEWPCVQKWSRQYFRDNYGDYVLALVGNPGLVEKENEHTYREVSLADYIDGIGKEKVNYLRFSRIIDETPSLKADFDVDWLDQFKSGYARGGYLYMFMGEAGSKTSMHNAMIQSLFIQIRGKKRWVIYAPNERIFLDVVSDRRPYYHTNANPNNPDDPRFPLLKYAKRYEVILDEGDVLWFPSYYWHYVENLTSNIGVTYKWTNFGQAAQMSKVLMGLSLFATRPSIIGSFIYNTFFKKDLVFDRRTQSRQRAVH